jgi:hypothetical protein
MWIRILEDLLYLNTGSKYRNVVKDGRHGVFFNTVGFEVEIGFAANCVLFSEFRTLLTFIRECSASKINKVSTSEALSANRCRWPVNAESQINIPKHNQSFFQGALSFLSSLPCLELHFTIKVFFRVL